MWRPIPDWDEKYKKENLHCIKHEQIGIKETFEAGADALLKELKQIGTRWHPIFNDGANTSWLDKPGWLVFIPDDKEAKS